MNPLFNSLFAAKQAPAAFPQAQAGNAQPGDWNALMGQLQANPTDALRTAGYSVPDEIAGNPQSAVMHLLRTGQIGGPMMQRIAPWLQKMGVR